MDLNARIYKYLEYKGITAKEMETRASLSNGAVSKMGNGTRRSTIDKLSNAFPDLNTVWLLTGEGDMLTSRDTTVTGSGNAVNTVTGNGNKVSANVAGDFADLASKFSEALKTSQEQLSSSQCQIDRLIKVIEKLSGVEK